MSREHAPRPGITWETELRSLGEVVVPDDDGDSPFGWSGPQANRATRRAARKQDRLSGSQSPQDAPAAPEPRPSPAGRSGGNEHTATGSPGPTRPGRLDRNSPENGHSGP